MLPSQYFTDQPDGFSITLICFAQERISAAFWRRGYWAVDEHPAAA
jgi:hypothetical protein